jgi:uncharacterized membrane protein YbaN (DUF454 family)
MGTVTSPIGALRRLALVGGGLICVGLGALGLVLPGLPATVFFIAAAACFSRSDPRLERWVLGLPKIGPAVRNYRAGLGMPKRAKRLAIASIVVFSSLSTLALDPWAARLAVLGVAAVGVWYVGRRVPTAAAAGV